MHVVNATGVNSLRTPSHLAVPKPDASLALSLLQWSRLQLRVLAGTA